MSGLEQTDKRKQDDTRLKDVASGVSGKQKIHPHKNDHKVLGEG